MTMMAQWRQRVVAQQEQFMRVRSTTGGNAEDSWEALTPSFTADPRRTNDPEVNRLLQEVQPAMTVLDVGGGAGRFALPLALHCQHVTVVEPAASMGNSLQQLAAAADIANVTLVATT